MEKITYQGHPLEVEEVNQVSGSDMAFTVVDRGRDIDESLFRDAEGRYYLQRRVGFEERLYVHRLSLTSAILWATMRSGWYTDALRIDARAILPRSETNAQPRVGRVRRALNLDHEIVQAAETYAAKHGRTFNEVVHASLRCWLERNTDASWQESVAALEGGLF